MEYASRYFMFLHQTRNGVEIEMLGVPVIGNRMSCPEDMNLKFGINCEAQKLSAFRDKNLIDSVRDEWGYDISGEKESDTIDDFLTML